MTATENTPNDPKDTPIDPKDLVCAKCGGRQVVDITPTYGPNAGKKLGVPCNRCRVVRGPGGHGRCRAARHVLAA